MGQQAEIKNRPREIWKLLKKENFLIITDRGKPEALKIDLTNEESLGQEKLKAVFDTGAVVSAPDTVRYEILPCLREKVNM